MLGNVRRKYAELSRLTRELIFLGLALILGLIFIVVGVGYWLLNSTAVMHLDAAGATMLIGLGIAMAFVFAVLLRGSREL